MKQTTTPSSSATLTTHRRPWRHVTGYLTAASVVAVVALLLVPLRSQMNPLTDTLLFLVVVTAISLRAGTGPSIVASLLAFLCIDFFLVPPYYTLIIAETDHVLTLLVFLGTSVLVTQMVVRVRTRTDDAVRRGKQNATLYDLSTALISQVGLDDTLTAIVARLHVVFALDTAAILLQEQGQLVPRSVAGSGALLEHAEIRERGRRAIERRQPERVEMSGHEVLLVPIVTNRQPLGVLLLARPAAYPAFDADERQIFSTFANQAAIAIERSLLTDERTRAEVLQRSDELKSALLSAVSHDLRTPLASIKASVTSLLQSDIDLPPSDRRDLLEAIDEESDRLNRLVANLLDLSRIEAGALHPDLQWNDVAEVIYDALDREAVALADHPLDLQIEPDLPPVRFDYVEIVQVLVNLLQNAARYAPPGSCIAVLAQRAGHEIEVAVSDEGPGIPLGEDERVFDKFYRVEAPHRPLGSGIGLAICHGFIEAHHGRIWVEPNEGTGSTFRFRLPVGATSDVALPLPVEQVVP